MKKRKIHVSIVSILLFMFFFSQISAQEKKSTMDRTNKAVNSWNGFVKLDEEQEVAIMKLATSYFSQCDSINALDSIPFYQKQELKKSAHILYIGKVKALMTENQLQIYERKQTALRAADEAKKKKKK